MMRLLGLLLLALAAGAGLLLGAAGVRGPRAGERRAPAAPHGTGSRRAELALPALLADTTARRSALAPRSSRDSPGGSLASVTLRLATPEGTPVTPAAVVLRQGARRLARAELDAAGGARFAGLVAGRYSLEVEAESLPPGLVLPPCAASGSPRVPFVLARGDAAEVPLVALPAAALQGRALDGASMPVAGARVRLQGADSTRLPSRLVTADDCGRFVLEGLVPGSYRIQLRWPAGGGQGAPPAPRVLALEPGERRTLVLRGEPEPVVIRGAVVDEDGRPLAGVVVQGELLEPPVSLASASSAREPPAPWSRVLARATTDAQGRFELAGLPRETILVRLAPRVGSHSGFGGGPTEHEEALAGRFDLRAHGTFLELGFTVLRRRGAQNG